MQFDVRIPDEYTLRNNVTWTSTLTGYSRNGFAYKASECFRDMRREGNQPNHFTFRSVLIACGFCSRVWSSAVQVHGCIVKSGIKTDIFVQSAVIAITETNIASFVHCLIVKTGYGTYKLVNNALVDMYAKMGIMDRGSVKLVKVFEGTIEKDVISWTALVTGNKHKLKNYINASCMDLSTSFLNHPS
ncbi:hypothetical protein F2Q69_00049619 [Brassica cretica]|uniref:Pentatricopeptide repeat-containing protein n=1 Tax=Brassica cretica TaxID=69181 RepID=A0A8S9Q8Q2_BRACR|nr:hypothetical protein F2Q69_00049619 [Brassica cretica]